MKTYSTKSFKYSIVASILLISLIISINIFQNFNSDTSSITIGLIVIAIGYTSIMGLIYTLRGIKEPNTAKKIIGLLVNFSIALLFIYVIVGNIIDIYRFLNEL